MPARRSRGQFWVWIQSFDKPVCHSFCGCTTVILQHFLIPWKGLLHKPQIYVVMNEIKETKGEQQNLTQQSSAGGLFHPLIRGCIQVCIFSFFPSQLSKVCSYRTNTPQASAPHRAGTFPEALATSDSCRTRISRQQMLKRRQEPSEQMKNPFGERMCTRLGAWLNKPFVFAIEFIWAQEL